MSIEQGLPLGLLRAVRVLPRELAHHAPDGEVVQVELVPVVVADGVLEGGHRLRVEGDAAQAHGPGPVHLEGNVHAAVHQVVPLEHLPEAAPLVLHATEVLVRAEGQREEVVGLLGVVVGAHLVRPELEGVPFHVPVRGLVAAREQGHQGPQGGARACGHGRPAPRGNHRRPLAMRAVRCAVWSGGAEARPDPGPPGVRTATDP
mmetsp:Transcript_6520/g.22293  ORF Transcript_6520/g.22293 Transcript_6520/m.22293 type:complete len:204 (+) Transcript_6520:2024-2635(+)